MKSAVLFFIIFSFSCAFAAQDAVVVTDGAMVYKKNDFDSPVIGYLRAGQKARVSDKTFGPFYRIQFKQGVVGYISDVDIQAADQQTRKNPIVSPRDKKSKSFIAKSYLGITTGILGFSEAFNNKQVTSNLLFLGAKYTFPIKYLSGPFVIDTEILYHGGYPSYYDSSVSRGESGKILIIDAEVFYSLYENRSRTLMFYVGAGPALTYSAFVVEISNSKKDLTEVLFGGVVSAGAAYRMGRFALKVEPKYFAQKSNYFGVLGSLQYEF